MRMFFGIIVGIILYHRRGLRVDSIRNTSGAEGSFDRPFVNWTWSITISKPYRPRSRRNGQVLTGTPRTTDFACPSGQLRVVNEKHVPAGRLRARVYVLIKPEHELKRFARGRLLTYFFFSFG